MSDESCYDDDAPAPGDGDDPMMTVASAGRLLSDEAIEEAAEVDIYATARWGTNMNGLFDTTDAREWAAAFVHLFGEVPPDAEGKGRPGVCPDEGTMLAWFAGALETGRTQGRRQMCPHPTDRRFITEDHALILCLECGKNLGEDVKTDLV